MSSAVTEFEALLASMLVARAPGVSGSKINGIREVAMKNVEVSKFSVKRWNQREGERRYGKTWTQYELVDIIYEHIYDVMGPTHSRNISCYWNPVWQRPQLWFASIFIPSVRSIVYLQSHCKKRRGEH